MLMGDNELIREMRLAADPKEQARILADLNGVPRDEMAEHLESLGVEILKRRGRKPGPKPKEKPAPAPVPSMAKKPDGVLLRKDEAEALYNHLATTIIDEIRNNEDYDCLEYLVSLVHICERCKEVAQ